MFYIFNKATMEKCRLWVVGSLVQTNRQPTTANRFLQMPHQSETELEGAGMDVCIAVIMSVTDEILG